MPIWLTQSEFDALCVLCDRMIPDDDGPGALEVGVPVYIDTLLGAFECDPPRIWAGGPTSGRKGGRGAFAEFCVLAPLQELAWRIRIEGSRGMAEREFNGPVVGWQQLYRASLGSLGADFCGLDPQEQDRRFAALEPAFRDLLYEHCCEGMYGAPEYGGNRDQIGWKSIGFPGDVQPIGWSNAEVCGP